MTYVFVWDSADVLRDILPYFAFFRCVYWASYLSTYFVRGYDGLKPGEKSLWGSAWCSSILSVWMPYLVLQVGADNGGKMLLFNYPYTFRDDRVVHMALIMAGYFSADLIPCMQHRGGWGKDWSVFALHHTAALWYFGSCIYFELGHGTLMTVCMVELSNAFNNNRMFISKAQVADGRSIAKAYPLVNVLNGVVFTLSFFVTRVIGFPFIGWWTLLENRTELLTYPLMFQVSLHFNFIIGVSMQFYWFDKIARGMYSLLTKSDKGKGVSGDDKMQSKNK